MRCVVPQLAWWLDTSPLFSVDFQPVNEDGSLRVVTCGTDTHVRVWWLKLDREHQPQQNDLKKEEPPAILGGPVSPKKPKGKDKIDIELRADLTRHQRTVSVVRFSHTGEILASGDDEANIILWKLQNSLPDGAPQLFEGGDNKENWQVFKVLRGHIEDVCDLQWSPRDSCLVSGSIDSSTILWDVASGRSLGFFKERKGFIQGVAYDPRGRFVAALSSDRQMYVYSTDTRKKIWVASKAEIPRQNGELVSTRLFHDDTLRSFCRRPDFSPDGEFLVAPSGVIEKEGTITNCVYVFHRSDLAKPVAMIPTNKQVTTAVRFSGKFYKLRNASGGFVALPYRMVFAVATINTILVCDTESFTPFAMIADAHYARISDLAWSPDNRMVMASSTDGYCSFIFFDEHELGERYTGDLPHTKVIEDVITRRKRTKVLKKKDDTDDSISEKK
ncbi:chromatin assembly factor 1 subunit B-like, partial [Tropilaelaps mercedesae]